MDQEAQTVTLHEIKLMILGEIASTSQPVHKFNLLGRPDLHAGMLSWKLKRTVTDDERALGAKAFDELRSSDLIRPTYRDVIDPENWVQITEAGRRAFDEGLLDDLDRALCSISAQLVEIRRGAWAALEAHRPDSLRQAAHSGRELIDQTLKEGAPDDEVRGHKDCWRFLKEDQVTRRARLYFLMRKHRGEIAESDLAISERAIDLALQIDQKLTAIAHGRSVPERRDVEEALSLAESALKRVLLN